MQRGCEGEKHAREQRDRRLTAGASAPPDPVPATGTDPAPESDPARDTDAARGAPTCQRRLLVLLGAAILVVLLDVAATMVDGRTIDFRMGNIENAAPFAPGHLAEHKVSLVPVRVTYVQEADGPVAVRLEDAP
jgi:hypothetical protein